MSAGPELTVKKRTHPRITVNTYPVLLKNYVAVNGDEDSSDASDTDDSPISPKIMPMRVAGTPNSAAFERKALRSASLGGAYVSRDAQKQFRIRAALGSYRDRVLSPLPTPLRSDMPAAPPPMANLSSPSTPSIQVSRSDSTTSLEAEEGAQQHVEQRAKLNQRILSLSAKRSGLPHQTDVLTSRPRLQLPSLDTLAAKYREKLSCREEPKSPRRQPLKSPKSPKRGKNLKALLERRIANCDAI